MGQKINPLGFRLGTTQGHHSLWFSQPKNYSEGLQEDRSKRYTLVIFHLFNKFSNEHNGPIVPMERRTYD